MITAIFHSKALKTSSCFILILFFLLSCSGSDDEEAILNLIKEGARLAEEQNVSELMAFTYDDFIASPGRHDRGKVKRILWLVFKRYKKFKILYPEPTIEIEENGSKAVVKIYFVIVRRDRSFPELKDFIKDPQGWIEEVGNKADLYQLDLELSKSGGEWLIEGARARSLKGQRF
jgi:hypothetical protein